MTTDSEIPESTVPAPVARAQLGVCLGCGTLILLSFLVLGYTVWRSDRRYSNDPSAVEATLQGIVSCQVPAGYRGFVSADVPGMQRIAVLAPTTLEGKRLKLDLPLLISAWSFSSKTTDSARSDEVVAFWATQIADRELTLGKTLRQTREAGEQLVVRGETFPALKVIFECERATVDLVFVQLPRGKGSSETMILAFAGDAATFDAKAMQAFLDSVR